MTTHMNLTDFRVSKTGVLLSLAYPVMFLALFFTLLVHLRLGIGRWPVHISDNPRTALFHAHEVATGVTFFIGLVLVPLGGVFALAIAGARRTRPLATCLALFTVGGLLAYAAMNLAPNSFIMWWQD